MPKGIPRDKSVQQKTLHRLSIAKGHLEKVIAMVEAGDYCIDVIHQSIAVQAALREVDKVVLTNHVKTCVADSFKDGNVDEVMAEIVKVLEKKR